MPARLVEIGRLAELYVHRPGQRKPDLIKIRDDRKNASHVAFDPRHKHQRIYLLIAGPERRGAARKFWSAQRKSMTLPAVAKLAGGRHATTDYPRVPVQPIGVLSHVTYLTDKKGDGLSYYIHEMGEEGGKPPILAVDPHGRLWLAGGSYTCPTPGIMR